MFFLLHIVTVCITVLSSGQTPLNSVPEAESGRIIHGNLTSDKGYWPFIVSIRKLTAKGRQTFWQHMCGGSVWDEETILTAAHCLLNNDTVIKKLWSLRVCVSYNDLRTMSMDYVFKVKSLTVHPEYDGTALLNDIGIITLQKKIDFAGKNKHAGCICEPEPLGKLDTEFCIIMGWGTHDPVMAALPKDKRKSEHSSPVLLESEVALLSDRDCKDSLPEFVYKNKLCTKDGLYGSRTCYGDSGGPLVCPVKNHGVYFYSQVGISAHGRADGCQVGPSYFTRVTSYLDWLENVTKKANNPAEPAVAPLSLFAGPFASVFGLAGAIGVGVLIGLAIRLSKGETDEPPEETN